MTSVNIEMRRQSIMTSQTQARDCVSNQHQLLRKPRDVASQLAHANYPDGMLLSLITWTVPTDKYHLPRDVEPFDLPRPKGPYPSGDGHY